MLTQIEHQFGPVRRVMLVGGGCVSSACRVDVAARTIFLKHDGSAPTGFFAAEAAGLAELRAKAGRNLRIPAVLHHHDEPSGVSWIALEWLEVTAAASGFGAALGAALARLHRNQGSSWGWGRDGFIGRLAQSNRSTRSWPDFWWRERLAPQLRLARSAGFCADPEWDTLPSHLPLLLEPAEADGPSLLHGDLWHGNALSTDEGPALIDPACYYGHREVDLAMSELFGGFGAEFYEAYDAAWPLAPGYPRRRAVYQLYYLLVHVNLFGAGYVRQTRAALREVAAGKAV